MKAPSLGIMPRWLYEQLFEQMLASGEIPVEDILTHKKKRLEVIHSAILRYEHVGKPVPTVWYVEQSDLRSQINIAEKTYGTSKD